MNSPSVTVRPTGEQGSHGIEVSKRMHLAHATKIDSDRERSVTQATGRRAKR